MKKYRITTQNTFDIDFDPKQMETVIEEIKSGKSNYIKIEEIELTEEVIKEVYSYTNEQHEK